MSTKTTILGMAKLAEEGYQMLLGRAGGLVFVGLMRKQTLYVLPIAASELAAVEQPGQLMALTVTHLLQQHAQHPGGNDKQDRIGVCFVEETFTDGVLSAEVELDARTLYRAKWPDLSLHAAFIACRASVRVDEQRAQLKRLHRGMLNRAMRTSGTGWRSSVLSYGV